MSAPSVLMIVLAAPLLFLGIGPAAALWRRRREKPIAPRRAAAPPLIIPSAEETAAVVERFRAAVRRFKREEFDLRRRTLKALTEPDVGGILRRRTDRRTSR